MAAIKHTVETPYNETLQNEDPAIMIDILQPSNSKMYGKERNITNPHYKEHILPVPGTVLYWEFHCTDTYMCDHFLKYQPEIKMPY